MSVQAFLLLALAACSSLVAGLDSVGVEDDYSTELPDEVPFLQKRMDSRGGEAKWNLGLGVLSNMQQFFDNLRNNLEAIESMPKEEREDLLGHANSISDSDRMIRPKATAAYLHALRNHRPSHKIRSFVAESEPANVAGTNHYDPNWLWTGLGRKR